MINTFRNICFRHLLNQDGTIGGESIFVVRSDAATSADARSEAIAWAGSIGSNMKVGGGGQNIVEEHPDFLLDSVEVKQTENEFIFELKLFGSPAKNAWTLLPGSETVSGENTTIYKCEYAFRGATPPSIPQFGEVMTDAEGKKLFCISSILKDNGNQHFNLALTYKNFTAATNSDTGSPSEIISIKDFFKDQILYRKAVFFWSNDVYSSKIAELHFHDPSLSLDWAGENFVLDQMTTSDPDGYGKLVELTAMKIEHKLISVKLNEDEDSKSAEATYQIPKSESESFRNLVGTAPVFVNGNYIISSVSIKDINPVLCKATVFARECKQETQLGSISAKYKEDSTGEKETEFFVPAAQVDSFRSGLVINSSAEWAGDNYYLESFEERNNALGSIFKLKAIEVYTRMLSMSQKEKFNGFTISGACCIKAIYQSVWQVHVDDFSDFSNLAGTSADWCNDDNIITEIVPQKISDIEYRIKIEAQRRTNPDLHNSYDNDNYEFLGNRVDVDCELIDFHFSAGNCGYYLHGDGLYDLLPAWNPLLECPLETEEPLPLSLVNNSIKILRISETVYKRGSMKRNIDDMIEWGQSRIYNGSVGNYYGSYLKNDIYAKEIYDNHGFQWSKITRIYDLAPKDTKWNPYYFRQLSL